MRSGDPYQLEGSPSDGTFSGVGVESLSGRFYLNLVAADTTKILYEYVNVHACFSSDFAILDVIDQAHQINGLSENEIICFEDSPKSVTALNDENFPGTFRLFDGDSTDVSSIGLDWRISLPQIIRR